MKSKLALFAASFCTAALVGNAAVVVNTDNATTFDGTYTDENGALTSGSGNATTFPLTSFNFELDGTGTQFSLFAMDGATVKGLEVIDVNDPVNPVTDGSLSGSFSVTGFNINYTYTIDGWAPDFSEISFDGTFSFTATPVVPEPSEYVAVAGMALIGFAAWRRSRSKVA